MKKKADDKKEMELIYTPMVAVTEAQKKDFESRVDKAYRILFEAVEKMVKEEKNRKDENLV